MLALEILELKGSDVATITPDRTIADALAELKERRIGALVVSSDQHTVTGIISERDIMLGIADNGAAALDVSVAEMMTTDVLTCSRDTSVEELMDLMTKRRFRHVPVVEDGQLVGIVSIGDVVKSRVDQLETETEDLVDYIRNPR